MTKEVPPLIRALFDLLPPPGSAWPADDRIRWMYAAVAIFDLIYGDMPNIKIESLP